MAISPTVNAYMQQGAEQDAPQDADQLFLNSFSDQAFNTLRAKFPALMNNVVTLKTLASDVEKGTAFGVFIIESGNNLVYIPAVMADGSIVSCEMAYDKDGDQFFALNQHTVKEILAKSQSSDPTIMRGNRNVEDTRAMFHNMMRPPMSSNVVLASRRMDIADLPNECKAALSHYLTEENPALLAKVATFYDVEFLASKLASKPETVKTASTEYSLPSFLRLDTLTKQAAELLSPRERKEIIRSGYMVKSAEDAPVLVAPADKLAPAVETRLELTTYPGGYNNEKFKACPARCCFEGGQCPVYPVGTAELFFCDAKGVSFTPVLLCGKEVIAADGRRRNVSERSTVLVRNPRFTHIDIDKFSKLLVPITKLLAEINKNEHSWPSVSVVVPMRNGAYSLIDTRGWLDAAEDKWKVVDNVLSVYNGQASITVSPDLQRGYITSGGTSLIVPEGSRFLVWCCSDSDKPLPAVESLTALQHFMPSIATKLTTTDNGAGIDITDRNEEKTASFAKRADAASWLHSKYGMDAPQIETVLNNKHSLVFAKTAYMDPSQQMQQQQQMQMQQQMQQQQMPQQQMQQMEMQQPMPQAMQPMQPNFQQLGDFAETEDPEMFDIGILASFAEYPDIKGLLVEYLPDFLSAEDKIGRVILLFSSQKKEIEEFYGTEKSSTMMNSLRRIFDILGNLVASLKLYVNMA